MLQHESDTKYDKFLSKIKRIIFVKNSRPKKTRRRIFRFRWVVVASEQAIPRGPDSDVAINPRKRAVEAVVQIYKHVAKPEGKIDYFCEDDKVVSGNTFLPTG